MDRRSVHAADSVALGGEWPDDKRAEALLVGQNSLSRRKAEPAAAPAQQPQLTRRRRVLRQAFWIPAFRAQSADLRPY